MANSSSEDETDTLPERPTRIQPYQFEPVRQDSERVPNIVSALKQTPCGIPRGVRNHTEVLATQMGVMQRSKRVSSFELYKFNPLSPHCRSIARELMHCYTWGCLRIVTVHGKPAVNFFVDHTHTQFTEESKMATALTPQPDVILGKSCD